MILLVIIATLVIIIIFVCFQSRKAKRQQPKILDVNTDRMGTIEPKVNRNNIEMNIRHNPESNHMNRVSQIEQPGINLEGNALTKTAGDEDDVSSSDEIVSNRT